MKYSNNDLKNIVALCEQGEGGEVADNLARRCKRALAYRDVSVKITARDRQFLLSLYDDDMDADAMETLKRVKGD